MRVFSKRHAGLWLIALPMPRLIKLNTMCKIKCSKPITTIYKSNKPKNSFWLLLKPLIIFLDAVKMNFQ